MGFRCYRQHDAMQCGIACMRMVCRHHGHDYALRELEQLCTPTHQGVSLKGMADLSDAVGLDHTAARVRLGQLRECPLPCVLHWDQNHFVVLHRVCHHGRRPYRVADPAKGLVRYSPQEFAAHWCPDGDMGIAMFFQPNQDFGRWQSPRPQAGVRGGERSWAFLLGYMRRYRAYFLQIGLGLLLGCLLQLAMPFLTQAIVDVGIRRQQLGFIWLVLLGELVIVVGRTAAEFIRRWLVLHISMRVNISLVSDFLIKLMRLPMSFFDTKQMGDLLQRIGDHQRVQSFLTSQTLNAAFAAVSFLVLGAVLAVYSWLIFAVFILATALYGGWAAAFLRRRRVLDYDLFTQQARNSNTTFEMVTSVPEIKLQDCRRRRRWAWEDVQADLFGVQMRALRLEQSQQAGAVFINEVKNILITVLAAAAVIDHSMTLGAMLAVQYIVGQLNGPVDQAMGLIYSLQDVKISLERINEIHRGPDENPPERRAVAAYVPGAARDIAISGARFRYDRHQPAMTIDGVDLTVPAGKVTAIVGASGSGKTTLVKLMLGYYPLEAGSLAVAGLPLDRCDLDWWRRRCGVVMQDGVIFSESVERNIAVDDGPVDAGRLRQAAAIANIDQFIESLPLRYATVIGRDGMGLSQGQRQRILIARAVYRDPEYIFLDEATNSLDAANERAITQRLARFYRGRTVVVVAHRLSTVRDADQIVVLDHGKVAETGTHQQLIDRRGAYYRLVKNQLELGA